MTATTAKERPILFSGPMVRAILSGQKSQTRRIVEPQPCEVSPRGEAGISVNRMPGLIRLRSSDPCLSTWDDACPYGAAGHRLWVREAWKPTGLFAGAIPRATRACGRFAYQADDQQLGRDKLIRWRPSIHMPRWASRITLEITDIRCERSQDISSDDARFEGVNMEPHDALINGEPGRYFPIDPVYEFGRLWNSINGVDTPLSWMANPWVWVVNFRRVE